MKKETIVRVKLIAGDGKILTDGKVYGREIFLSVDTDENSFYEIGEEEYEKILEGESGVTEECLTLF